MKLENIRRNLLAEVKVEKDGYNGVEEGAAQAVEGLGWEEDAGEWMEDGGVEEDVAEEGGDEEMEEVEVQNVEEVMSSGDEAPAKEGGRRYVAPWGRRAPTDWVVSIDKWGGSEIRQWLVLVPQ